MYLTNPSLTLSERFARSDSPPPMFSALTRLLFPPANSCRKTASNLDVQSVMDALASPSPAGAGALAGRAREAAGDGGGSAASSKKAKRGHHRRLTADSALKGVFDDDSMTGEGDSPVPGAAAAAADAGDATADFSAIFDLVGKELPAPTPSSSQLGAAAAATASSPPAATPRAKRLGNQKPGRDGLAEGLHEPISSLPGASVTASSGGGEEEEAGPSASNPAAPTQRVQRPRDSISRATPPDTWGELAAPTPEPVRRRGRGGRRVRARELCVGFRLALGVGGVGVFWFGSFCMGRERCGTFGAGVGSRLRRGEAT